MAQVYRIAAGQNSENGARQRGWNRTIHEYSSTVLPIFFGEEIHYGVDRAGAFSIPSWASAGESPDLSRSGRDQYLRPLFADNAGTDLAGASGIARLCRVSHL